MIGQTHIGDCRQVMQDMVDAGIRVQCVVTSPPYYGLRDYGTDGQIGLEPTFGEWLANMVEVFEHVWQVMADDAVCWVNMGDSYASKASEGVGYTFKPKDRLMQPARLAIALQDNGFWLRDEIVWHKPNPMPCSVKDRTTPAHEMAYLLSKKARYYFDHEAIREHADRPEWRDEDAVFDPFMGSGTVARVAERLGRRWIGAELNAKYLGIQHRLNTGRTMGMAL